MITAIIIANRLYIEIPPFYCRTGRDPSLPDKKLSELPGNVAGSAFGFGPDIGRKFFHDGFMQRVSKIAFFD